MPNGTNLTYKVLVNKKIKMCDLYVSISYYSPFLGTVATLGSISFFFLTFRFQHQHQRLAITASGHHCNNGRVDVVALVVRRHAESGWSKEGVMATLLAAGGQRDKSEQ